MSTILFAFISLFISCNSTSNDDGAVVITKPSNLTLKIEKVGATSDNKDGDGSGAVNFTLNADNVTSYKVLIDGESQSVSKNEFSHTFTEPGTADHNIMVSAYKGTEFISKTFTVKVFVKEKLIWSDEFDVDGAPDSGKWALELGNNNGWGNNEKQFYTAQRENSIVEDGILKIRTIKENHQDFGYTSARMITKGKFEFTYGKIEMRAKLPQGKGTWPAFWLLGANYETVGWPACGEIDIMESVGNRQDVIHSTLHSPGRSGASPDTKTIEIPNTTTEFHVYKAEWREKSIKFYVDDTLFYTFTNSKDFPFDHDFFILLNCAMGGNFGGEIAPDFSSSVYEIDYIRVYN